MLVLSRKVGESITVTGPCTITLNTIAGTNRVTLGFDAPDETRIFRTEILPQPIVEKNPDVVSEKSKNPLILSRREIARRRPYHKGR